MNLEDLIPNTRSKTRNLAQSWIQGGIIRGMGSNEITDMLIDHDLSYRRQEMLRDIRTWRSIIEQNNNYKYVSNDYVYNDDNYIPTNRTLESNYIDIMKIHYRNNDTGEVTDKYVSILHNHEYNGEIERDMSNIYTKGELKDMAANIMDQYGLNVSILGITREQGWRRVEWMEPRD